MVREIEVLVKKILELKFEKEKFLKDFDVLSLENKLLEQFGVKVLIDYNEKGKGKLVINYVFLNELDGIIVKFSN